MSNPKAQFQVDHGSGWETVAEVDIIDGVVRPPNAWTMVRALRKQIVYTDSVSEEITIAPSTPRDTHFAGWAKAVRREEQNKMCGIGLDDWTPTKSEKVGRDVVARRAYDLAWHILWYSIPTIKKYNDLPIEEIISIIPDLTELPKEEREQ